MSDHPIDPQPAEPTAETTPDPTPDPPAEPTPDPPAEPTPEPPAEPTTQPEVRARRSFRRPGRRTRTVLRWSVATVLCLGVGAGTAFAVMAPKRTDMPGLATASDGRYSYPALHLPELPPGATGPGEGGAPSGAPGGTVPHAADIRQLLLPAPAGAVHDPALPGPGAWLSTSDYAKLFAEPGGVTALLAENGARHIAATGWRMPDGTHVAVYLVAFRSGDTSTALVSGETLLAPASAPDLDFGTPEQVPQGTAQSVARAASGGKPALRMAIFSDVDVAGVLVLTNPKAVNPVDYRQALTLQLELLGG